MVMGGCNVRVRASARDSAVGLAQSRRASYANGPVTVHSSKLSCCFHCSIMRHKAASAVESHWWQPYIIPVCVVIVRRWLHQPFRRPDELLIMQNVDGLEGEGDPKVVLPGVLLGWLKAVVGPSGLHDVWPTVFANTKQDNELRRQRFWGKPELPNDLIDDLSGPGTWITADGLPGFLPLVWFRVQSPQSSSSSNTSLGSRRQSNPRRRETGDRERRVVAWSCIALTLREEPSVCTSREELCCAGVPGHASDQRAASHCH